ncbi:MAG: tetratricopeptide repeat protein, partial [Desulfurobacteriaceae bacterium]
AYQYAKEVKSVSELPKEERAPFLAKLARYYKLTGNKEEALKLVSQLLKEGDPSKVDYDDLISLSLLAQERGSTDVAKRLIDEALKRAENKEQRAESLFWKASIEAQEGKIDDAIIDYMKIAYDFKGIEPWSSTALYRAAQLFEEKGNYRQALKLYRKVSKLKRGTKEGEIAAEKVKSLLKKIKEE